MGDQWNNQRRNQNNQNGFIGWDQEYGPGSGHMMGYPPSQPQQRRYPPAQQYQQTYHHQQNMPPSYNNYMPPPQQHYPPVDARMSQVGSRPYGGASFNPNAAPFIPSGVFSYEPVSAPYGSEFSDRSRHQQTDPRMSSYTSDEAAYDAMYQTSGTAQQYIPSQDLQQKMMSAGSGTALLNEVLVGFEQILSDSDEFDSWATAIRDRLADRLLTDDGRIVAVRIAFEMAMVPSPEPLLYTTGPSPQHVLARLLAYLSREMDSLLENAILPVMENLHTSRPSLDAQQRLNLLKFFAEVYDKLETTGGHKIEKIGEAVVEQTSDLLKPQEINDATMKAIIQVVKLSGPSLDSKQSTRVGCDELLTKLNAFARGHPQLSESIKAQINVVVEQRESGWGLIRADSSHPGQIVDTNGVPIVLSEEERTFLEEHFGELDDDDSDVLAELERFEADERKQHEQNNQLLMEKLKLCDEDKTEQK